jgi:hypothetical protein
MNSSRTVQGALAAFLLFCVTATGATIKVKSGAVHEGKIQGVIVLKGNERETTSEADPSKTVYAATYTVLNGADITAIDEKGVHGTGKPVGVLDVTQEGDTLDDLDIVRTGLKIKPGPSAFASTKKAGTITRVDHRAPSSPAPDAIIGDFREAGGELRPTLEIETAKGIVKVPVADLASVAAE